jgi:non-heme chloroperoxidase
MAKFAVESENGVPVELHYTDHGEGDPVVLIHGWPLSGRAWEPQEAVLIEAGYRVIIYDRRGFGASSQPWGGYDYDTFASDLDALLNHLGVQGATLVGFSMGGGEVARYVATYGSERVVKAVFASAVTPYLFKSDDNPDGGLDDATIAEFEASVQTDRLAFLEDFTARFFSAGRKLKVSEHQRQFAKLIASLASPKATLDCIGAWGRTDFREDLATIDMPVLVIHGDSDGIVPFEVSGRRTAASIPGAELVVIKDGPHGVNLSHAGEFNAALLGFLGR